MFTLRWPALRPVPPLAAPHTEAGPTEAGDADADADAGPLTIPATVEQLLLVASLFWTAAMNRPFFGAVLRGRALDDLSAWGMALAMFVLVAALHFALLALLANRFTVKPLLAVLIVASASASHFMSAYGVVLDATMLRNVLRTDPGEASELISLALVAHLALYAVLPLALLWRVRIVNRRWPRALAVRLATLALAAVVVAGSVLAVFQPFASLMRNHKELRYLITPANVLWSSASVVAADARGAAAPRQAIGLDARLGPVAASRHRPLVVVLVVGETARAANWGLGGYARQTTPQLAQLAPINFSQVESCGTNTESSLPCMFAPVGRRDYQEAQIRGSESLLHVLARAGVGVHWRDNQSGCKGVCDGLANDRVSGANAPGLCEGGRCLDEGLIQDLDQRLAKAEGSQLWVLHQLGNHGPSYFRRYPREFARFQPACEQDDLRLCSREQIVNAYDNALLYTDHVLAQLIGRLKAAEHEVDTALVYVSDHGESLGESGLFLHGMPYAIAPEVQTRVPMVMWASSGFADAAGIDWDCLRRRAARPASHDHLFHTLLGLLDVRTGLLAPDWDLGQGCRAPTLDAQAAH